MKNRYLVHIPQAQEDVHLEHAQDAYTRRMNYDRNQRHLRYLRDRDAGKTGYKGVTARTSNPYGNYASLYYNPTKAAEYYRTKVQPKLKARRATEKGSSNVAEEAGSGEADGAGGSGGAGGAGGAGDYGGSGAPGESGAGDRAAAAAARQAINEKIQKLRENSRFETAAQKQAAKMEIEKLKKSLEKRLKRFQKQSNRVAKAGEKQRKHLSDRADKKLENTKNSNKQNVEKDTKKLKTKKEKAVAPFRKKNAELRGRLDSMSRTSNRQLYLRLRKQLASNNDKISKANAEYTDSLYKMKTQHSINMRNSINKIRADLYNARQASMGTQRSRMASIQASVYKVRQANANQINKVNQRLSQWIENEQTRVGQEIAGLRGVPYEDPKAAQKKYETKVKRRAKEIVNSRTR